MERNFGKGTNDSLSQEITQKFEKIKKESEENNTMKHAWVGNLQSIARERYPNAQLVLTGSSGNMFCFKESDCDLTLISGERYIVAATALGNIEELLPRRKYRTELVRGAKVPILKIKDRENSFEADINCERELNIRHTFLLRCYAQLDPRVLPLGLVIKLWAKMAGIINQRDHKLSGFTLLLLYIYYLQVGCSPPVVPLLQINYPTLFSPSRQTTTLIAHLKSKELPEELRSFKSSNGQTLGELLVGFFRFYANFNWSSKVISISRSSAYVSNNRTLMKIEDPYDVGGNCARGIYDYSSFMQIKNAFTKASRKIEESMNVNSIL